LRDGAPDENSANDNRNENPIQKPAIHGCVVSENAGNQSRFQHHRTPGGRSRTEILIKFPHTEDGFSASPALAGNELYLRGERHLFCIAETDAAR